MSNMRCLVLLAALLSGCASMPGIDSPLFLKYKYVVSIVPDALLAIPPPTYKVDPTAITDKEGGKWIVDDKARSIELEKRLKSIKAWQDNELLQLKKLPEADVIKR